MQLTSRMEHQNEDETAPEPSPSPTKSPSKSAVKSPSKTTKDSPRTSPSPSAENFDNCNGHGSPAGSSGAGPESSGENGPQEDRGSSEDRGSHGDPDEGPSEDRSPSPEDERMENESPLGEQDGDASGSEEPSGSPNGTKVEKNDSKSSNRNQTGSDRKETGLKNNTGLEAPASPTKQAVMELVDDLLETTERSEGSNQSRSLDEDSFLMSVGSYKGQPKVKVLGVNQNARPTSADSSKTDKSLRSVSRSMDSREASAEMEELDDEMESEASDVEFIDEVPRQAQNRAEADVVTNPSVPVTPEVMTERLLELVAKKMKGPKQEQNIKITDLLNRFVQKESQQSPLGVRKILDNKEFRTPVTLSIPPSQVVHFLAEYQSDKPIKSLLVDAEPIIESNTERRHRQEFKMMYPAPAMTRTLYDIGLQLAQESTYADIVKMRNLPAEMPKKPETIKKVIEQVKPYLDMLRKETAVYKMPNKKCETCNFKTESQLAMNHHLAYPHERHGKWYCGFCKFFCSDEDDMESHYKLEHGSEARFETPMPKAPCGYCQEEFQFKNLLYAHQKTCRKDWRQRSNYQKTEADLSASNLWLWTKPLLVDPIVHGLSGVRVLTGNTPTTGIQLVQQQSGQLGSHMVTYPPGSKVPGPSFRQIGTPAGGSLASGQSSVAAMLHARRNGPNILPRNHQLALQQQQQQQQMLIQQRMMAQERYKQMQAQQNARKAAAQPNRMGLATPSGAMPGHVSSAGDGGACEICDQVQPDRRRYFAHLQLFHQRLLNKTYSDFMGGAPLACSRCRDRFWTYEGLERHLVMLHGLVTSDLLQKAQAKNDGGRCIFCQKQYAFNLLQHLVMEHKKKLCSAEILYSCDVCTFQCTSYGDLEKHLSDKHGASQAPSTSQHRPGPASFQSRFQVAQKRPSPASARPGGWGPQCKRPKIQEPVRPTRVRYTCTPCALKFAQYSDVISHWQDKHLAKIKIPICRIDQCDSCKSIIPSDLKIDWEEPDIIEEPKSDVICLD